ncbi:hypothetical protein BVY03_01845 [bacterium K02(2017)]|nr:hypothetical protein BVY03_01845 [bacterium K02(2017)]
MRYIIFTLVLFITFSFSNQLVWAIDTPPAQDFTVTSNTQPEKVPEKVPGTINAKITIVNNSKYNIKKVRCIAMSHGSNQTSTEFGPIPAQGKKTSIFSAWRSGSFAVEVEYEADGKIIKSRPFSSNLKTSRPITIPILTFGNSRRGKGGVWKNIVWQRTTAPADTTGASTTDGAS